MKGGETGFWALVCDRAKYFKAQSASLNVGNTRGFFG
jgi:hypothetical protein